MQEAAVIRLDKLLCEMGAGSRSEVKAMLKKGRVTVDGQPVLSGDRKVPERGATVCLDGQPLTYAGRVYYVVHKPAGVVTAVKDAREKTVMDLMRDAPGKDLFPAGRLDKDTEGLLLITNDGDLAHRLLSPRKHVDKVYYARIQGRLPQDAVSRMEQGLVLEDGLCTLPALLEILEDRKGDGESQVRLTIREGKFHQVKRMFEALGCRVVYLKRLSMGPLVLDETLSPGQCRPLTDEELRKLSNA